MPGSFRPRLPALLLAAGAAAGGAGCRPTPLAFGTTPAEAATAATDLTRGFALRLTDVTRDARFERARNRMGRFALAPSELFPDSTIWNRLDQPAARTLLVEGLASPGGFRFAARPDAPEPARLGDQRHRMELSRLPGGDWRWRTWVEHDIGRFPPDQLGPVLIASLDGATRGTAAVRADLRELFPRASAAFGRLVALDTVIATPLGDGTHRLLLRSRIEPQRLAATMPAFAAYLRRYVSPMQYRLSVTDRSGATYLDVVQVRDTLTITTRVRRGIPVAAEGAPRPLPDTLRLRVMARTRYGLWTVGVHRLDGDLVIDRTPGQRLWRFRFREEPDWQLPFGTETLLHRSLRRPFEGEGMRVLLGFRRGAGGRTQSVREVELAVRESWIVRWLGKLGFTVYNDFVGPAEVEENRYLAEGLLAFGADLRRILGAPD